MNRSPRSVPARLRALAMAAACFAAAAANVSVAHAHEGEPVDPAVTENTPREHSKLYVERKLLPWTKLEDGIEMQEIRPGTGAAPHKDALVYVMWRMYDLKDGKEIFYRTKHRTDHFFYGGTDKDTLGGGGALRAVELALKDMREGGKRLLTVTADKAFGKEGWSDSHFVVPPGTDVIVELSLIWVRDPDPKRFTAGRPHPRPDAASGGKETGPKETTGPLAGTVAHDEHTSR